jgi:hypothetical protein
MYLLEASHVFNTLCFIKPRVHQERGLQLRFFIFLLLHGWDCMYMVLWAMRAWAYVGYIPASAYVGYVPVSGYPPAK